MTSAILSVRPELGPQAFVTQLDGVSFKFHLWYMEYTQSWYMHLHNANDEPLVTGIRLVPGYPMLRQYRNTVDGMPDGDILLVDLQGTWDDPAEEEDVGVRYKLFYMDREFYAEGGALSVVQPPGKSE